VFFYGKEKESGAMVIDEQRKKPKNTGLKIFGILYFSFLNIHFGGVGQKYPDRSNSYASGLFFLTSSISSLISEDIPSFSSHLNLKNQTPIFIGLS
jgi:hypothetical protein